MPFNVCGVWVQVCVCVFGVSKEEFSLDRILHFVYRLSKIKVCVCAYVCACMPLLRANIASCPCVCVCVRCGGVCAPELCECGCGFRCMYVP